MVVSSHYEPPVAQQGSALGRELIEGPKDRAMEADDKAPYGKRQLGPTMPVTPAAFLA